MVINFKILLLLASSLIIFAFCFSSAYADKEKKGKSEHESFSAITNETYKIECGACHFNYHPGLLPARSWKKILGALPSHFNEEVTLDDNSFKEIEKYLTDNAAEKSSSKRAKKILKSLGGETPIRITETPYIKEKHQKLSPAIFAKPAIGSQSNCIACHTTAEQGNYDDDSVKIPE